MANPEKSFFTWDTKFALDIKAMDNDHKHLLKLMNDLYLLNDTKAGFSLINMKLDELAKFTEKHFREEEELFSTLPYEKTEVHKNIHKNLLARLSGYAAEIKTSKKIGDDFFGFLKVWLSAHIIGIDQGYAAANKSISKSNAG